MFIIIKQKTKEIDLMEIFRALRKQWYWIVLLAIVFGAALGVYGKFIVKDANDFG